MQIPIFYAINDQYAPLLSVSLKSLVNHTSADNQYIVTVLYQTLSKENQDKLVSLATDNVAIRFSALDEQFSKLFDKDHNLLLADFHTLTIYYRLFIADMFPNEQKAIYLDADTLVMQDIAGLYQIDLGEHAIGAVTDQLLAIDPDLATYPTKVVGVDRANYVNSGVLLLDLAKLRQEKFSQHFLELLQQYHFKLIAADQDYLNAMAHDAMTFLPVKWNDQTTVPIDENGDVGLVHYNLFRKPWHYRDVPFREAFWQAADQTPYAKVLHNTLSQYNESDTTADDQKHQRLVATANELLKEPVTLRTVLSQKVS
ncbi:lipopolysaccharide biosynthesis glycosyltransferase [Secundilactobacillus pentosiphilus]|uniref:Lipopolysaccharide biosynthesis glycosyltransferase n=1 Tax=Secundilactobacillus pentosiphilus TaxID=1714682 RepID=A0A1Z5ILK4_9LACO|nr:glycosyltransferase family 8 protein [Secundilactobacillus pentosiphilus]GAX02619.1 lipopolysaccharide biosynthesis glycosyltransferase [Secundilactobacillus pentosiphilus]